MRNALRPALSFIAIPTLLLAIASPALAAASDDWPRWRGAHFDDASRETGVFGKNVSLRTVWKKEIGSGYSAVSVIRDYAVTLASVGGFDYVIALDAGTGEERWQRRIDVTFAGKDGAVDGPISTPTLSDDSVYALGPNGHLLAIDLESGAERWRVDLMRTHSARQPHWGFTTAPLLAGDLLIVQVGGPRGEAFAAFDCRSGAVRWQAGTDRVEYQSPILMDVAGRELAICIGDTLAFGLDPKTGEEVWRTRHGGADFYAKIVNPLVIEGELFIKHRQTHAKLVALGEPGADFALEQIWETRNINSNYSLPVAFDGHIYGYGGSFLGCVDQAFGERVWRSRTPGDGWLNLVDEHLVVLTKAGSLHIARATPDGYDERAALQLFDRLIWTPPSFAGGRVFARDSYAEIACVEIVSTKESASVADAGAANSSLIAELTESIAAASDKASAVTAFMKAQASFPVIENDRLAHFFYRGDGDELALRGDMLPDGAAMQRIPGTNLFHASVELEPDVRVGYQFIRDLEDTFIDPLNPESGRSFRLGVSSSLTMPEAEPGAATASSTDVADDPKGSMVSFSLDTPVIEVGKLTFGGPRPVDVYLPAGYDETDQRYPVLYVHDGRTAINSIGMTAVLDEWIASSGRPLIVAFISLMSGYELARSQRHVYRDVIVDRVVPHMDAEFRTIADRAHRAMYGFDEGGCSALSIPLQNPDVFGFACAQSLYQGSRQNEDELRRLVAECELLPNVVLNWGSYDTRDAVRQIDTPTFSRELAERLRARGANVYGGERREGSLFSYWAERLPALFEAFVPPGD